MSSRHRRPATLLLAGALLSTLLLTAGAARAAFYDPALRWRTIRTPHFHIHYPEGLELEAGTVSGVAEEVHRTLTALVGWTPAQPTEVTLVDRTDLANGYTSVLPYNQMVLYPVRPPLWEGVGDYDGWLRALFVHEYSHVLGLDPVRGYAAVVRSIFGRVSAPLTPVGALFWLFTAPPNAFLPPWFHEGMAVNFESELTGRGRRDSTFSRMVFRTDVASGSIPPLDRLAGGFPGWPSGHTPYLYGSRLLAIVRRDRGAEGIGKLVVGHSGRFPYTTDNPARRVTGRTYGGLYQRMREELEAEYRPAIRNLEAQGLTPFRTVTASGFATSGPVWLSGDALVFTRYDGVRPPSLVRLELADGRERVLADRAGISSPPTRLPDGGLVFARTEVSRPLAGGLLFGDLYRCAPSGGGVRRLTHAARVVDADFSSVARAFVAVQNDASRQRLALLTPDGSPTRVLLQEPGFRYDGPRWSPDGRWVAFARKPERGPPRVALLEVATGALRLLTPEGSQAGFPTWSPDGRQIAFSWDRSGVWDLYACEVETGACRRLTRVLTGAFEPEWSPDGSRIAFTSYSSRGFDVSILDLGSALSEPVLPAREPEQVASEAPPPPEAPPASRPYSAWPRVLPTFWLPDLSADNQGLAPGVWTSGHDPLFRHLYYAAAYWAGSSGRPYGQALYVNDVTYPTVSLRAWKLPIPYTDLFPGTGLDYWEENRTVGLEARFRLPRVRRQWSAAVSWAWEEVSRLSRVDEDLGGRRDLAGLPFEGRLNPLAFSLLYDSSFPYANFFTAGPESGLRAETIYRWRTAALGSDLERRELVLDGRKYLRLARTGGVLAAHGKFGLAEGDRTLQSSFSVGGELGEFPVRGYPVRVDRGERAALLSAELRFPLWSPYRGIRDWPTFLGKVQAVPFFDAGKAWDGGDGRWRRGLGGELRLDTLLGYYFPTTLVLGFAHGLDDEGEDRFYFTLAQVY